MSIEAEVKALAFRAAEPEIEAASVYLMDGADVYETAPLMIALVRVLAHVICLGQPEVRERATDAIIATLRARVRDGGEI